MIKFINIINKNNYQRNLTLIHKLINEIGYLSFSKVLILSFLENIFDLLSLGLILSIIFADQNLILLNPQVSLNYKILFFIILISFKSLSKVKISILKNIIILELNRKISIQLFSSILYSPLEKVNKIGRGEAFSLLRNDVIKTINSITQFINFFQNLLTLIIFICYI